ncbi:MAG: methyltransferase domain-containing protein [Thermoplasmata archaeon]
MTTRLEREIVGDAISKVPPDRVLEVGLGGGRITPVLRSRFSEYVGIDVTLAFLQPGRLADPTSPPYFAADVHELPFATGAFRAVVMIRVYNFLVDPARALRELARVLAPGGILMMSYHPVPSLGTLTEDLRHLLASERNPGFEPVTFRRREIHQPRRDRVLREVRRAGFTVVGERVTGLEDNRFGRRLPMGSLRALSSLTSAWSILPHRFLQATTPGEAPTDLPDRKDVVVCPKCRAPLDLGGTPPREHVTCPGCRAIFPVRSGILDFR